RTRSRWRLAPPNDELRRDALEWARMKSVALTTRCSHNHQTAYGHSIRQVRLIGSGPCAEDRTLSAIARNPWRNPLTGASRCTRVRGLGGSVCSLCVFQISLWPNANANDGARRAGARSARAVADRATARQ